MSFLNKISRFIRNYWIQIAFLDFDFDTEDAISIDICNIMLGSGSGIKFYGSLFYLYYQPNYGFMGDPPHFTCDILYLKQWWKSNTDPED